MKNIQKQMDTISRNESKWGTIIDVRSNRCVGKTFNIEKVAEYFDFTVIKKHHGSEPRTNVEILQHAIPNHIKGKNQIYVIDEGYSLGDIMEFMKSGKIAFALWTSDYESKFVTLDTD